MPLPRESDRRLCQSKYPIRAQRLADLGRELVKGMPGAGVQLFARLPQLTNSDHAEKLRPKKTKRAPRQAMYWLGREGWPDCARLVDGRADAAVKSWRPSCLVSVWPPGGAQLWARGWPIYGTQGCAKSHAASGGGPPKDGPAGACSSAIPSTQTKARRHVIGGREVWCDPKTSIWARKPQYWMVTVTARRFWAQALSSEPRAAGRSLP